MARSLAFLESSSVPKYVDTLYRLLLFLDRILGKYKEKLLQIQGCFDLVEKLQEILEQLKSGENPVQGIVTILTLLLQQELKSSESRSNLVLSLFFICLCVKGLGFKMARNCSGYLSHIRWHLRAALVTVQIRDS